MEEQPSPDATLEGAYGEDDLESYQEDTPPAVGPLYTRGVLVFPGARSVFENHRKPHWARSTWAAPQSSAGNTHLGPTLR